jgi:PqqD family protein of HPr-rel-A system
MRLNTLLGSSSMPSYRLREGAVAWRAFDGEGTLLHLDRQEIHAMNAAATVLIERMRGGAVSEEELVARLQEEFEVDEDTARRDVSAFLERLREADVLDVTDQSG